MALSNRKLKQKLRAEIAVSLTSSATTADGNESANLNPDSKSQTQLLKLLLDSIVESDLDALGVGDSGPKHWDRPDPCGVRTKSIRWVRPHPYGVRRSGVRKSGVRRSGVGSIVRVGHEALNLSQWITWRGAQRWDRPEGCAALGSTEGLRCGEELCTLGSAGWLCCDDRSSVRSWKCTG
ncbi:hypothetical protein LWI29_032164 [Acer saccharum]|uniref:Uncharacterized protein n=1 Tax=Acer saccharum TaxID=4024 RepID=A0AA39SPJ7_ACESA|nr:hypothetical protein LWI29_032164 [Acer saccharum]